MLYEVITIKCYRRCVTQINIANEILMYLRTIKKYQNDVSLQDPIGIDKEGNAIALISYNFV